MIGFRVLVLLAVGALGALLPACPTSTSNNVREGCVSDIDCGQDRRCDIANGVCRCTDDAACDPSEFCNAAGSCQPKTECLTDDDCGGLPNICDTRKPNLGDGPDDNVFSKSSGQCVSLSATLQCLMDSHCQFGAFCNSQACLPGCRDNGDCPLGQPCLSGQCDSSPGACNEAGYCEFGEICDPSTSRCEPHAAANELCQRCDPANFGEPCADACLIDNSIPPTACNNDAECDQGRCVVLPCFQDTDCVFGTCQGAGLFTPGECDGYCGDFFCGANDCDDVSNPCPRGYSCFQLVATSDVSCSRGGGECPSSSFCTADEPGENLESGFCACGPDVGCPFGTTCVDGGCLIGSTCGPASGLLCEDLLQ